MRQVDADTLSALAGSRAGESLSVYAWYDGRLAYPGALPVSAAAFQWDRSRQVQTFTCTVADKDGKLAPWLLEDPLGVGGSRLQVRWNVGGSTSPINMGWYPVRGSVPKEKWHSLIIDELGRVNPGSPIPKDKRLMMVSGGATIAVRAEDAASTIKKSRLLAPEAPVGASPTVVGEIKRLLRDICPVVTGAGVVDREVNTTLIYERDRLDAVQALCKSIACDYRMNGEGQFEVYSILPQSPVVTLRGGPEGMLVEVDREQSDEGLNNVFVVNGTDGDQPVRAVSAIETGNMRADGPMGYVPTFYESQMIGTQSQADAYAITMRDTHIAGLTTDLRVTCLPIPHVQQGDWVRVANPVVNGQEVQLVGMVKSINQPWGLLPGPCTVVVECSYAEVQALIVGVNRG